MAVVTVWTDGVSTCLACGAEFRTENEDMIFAHSCKRGFLGRFSIFTYVETPEIERRWFRRLDAC